MNRDATRGTRTFQLPFPPLLTFFKSNPLRERIELELELGGKWYSIKFRLHSLIHNLYSQVFRQYLKEEDSWADIFPQLAADPPQILSAEQADNLTSRNKYVHVYPRAQQANLDKNCLNASSYEA